MSGRSTYLGNSFLNVIRGTAYTAPSAVYVALFNGDPTDAGTGGSEVTTTIRTAGRVAATFGAPSAKAMSNSAAVSFGNAAGAATVTHYALFDAASAGNMLDSAPLTGGSMAVSANSAVSFAVGAIVIND